MLTIALEPEVAANYIKHLPVEKRVDGKEGDVFQTFSPVSKYIVVDAGGLLCIICNTIIDKTIQMIHNNISRPPVKIK